LIASGTDVLLFENINYVSDHQIDVIWQQFLRKS